ncbi:hypothetical protein EON79_15620 [bacterium]|nr:MAG: hypothetical protein EON79_15620 [bacterium]
MVELWSTLSYAPISQARVLDSGRSFFVRAEPFDKGEAQRAVMVVNSPDGDQMGGIDLFQPPASFRTAAEALKKVRLDQMTVKAGGVALAREIEGVKYRAPVAETFRLPLGGGRVWEFQIGPRQFGPPGDGISWTSPSGR